MTPDLVLAEDSPEDVELILGALTRTVDPSAILVVRDGAEALEFFFARGRYVGRDPFEQPRLTLLDLNLPLVPGLEVLRQLRNDHVTRRMPVVILSAGAVPRDVRTAMTLGANSFIRKPMDGSRLADTLATVASYWLDINIAPPAPEAMERP